MAGHSAGIRSSAALATLHAPSRTEAPAARLSIAEVYEAHFDFVWRSARRLGVAHDSLDDVAQDVFVAVHRRLSEFEGRSTLKTWLYGIAIRVVRDHRRRARRKPSQPLPGEELADAQGCDPERRASQAEQLALLHRLLETLDDDKREVFVLAELEQLSAPEIGAALDLNVNTVYARLRSARIAFDQALSRHRARTAGKP
jgi:RNA polymerase sigma-70 factor (ECF subfamily)